MKFEGQYLTHEEYKLLKGTLEKVPFDLLEYDVRKMIDNRTLGRLINVSKEEFPNDIKICVFKMVEVKKRYQMLKSQNNAISSESTDGYSVTYKKHEKADIEAENKELYDIMETDLANVIINGTSVLYSGVNIC